MPRQTFFNLPEEKRQRIIDMAIEEFASLPYAKASLSKIVARAGISKGSMYQYFEDKKDLIFYLLELAAKEKLSYIQQEVDPEADFFKAFEQSMMAGTRFNLEHPKLNRVIANAMGSSGEEVLHDFIAQGKKMSFTYFSKMIIKGQEQGSIRQDIDVGLVSHFVASMLSKGLTEYILDMLGVDSVDELMKMPELAEKINEKTVRKIVDETMKLLRTGLQPSN